jgi:hypothetical protein
MTPEVTKTALKKIILKVWIENGPICVQCCLPSVINWLRNQYSQNKLEKSIHVFLNFFVYILVFEFFFRESFSLQSHLGG